MFVKRQIMIFALTCFQFLGNTKPVEGSSAVEMFCKDLCSIRNPQTGVPTPDEIMTCEKLCMIRVEVGDFGRKISTLQWNNNPTANVVVYPFSVVALLNLLILGTSGDTNREIKEAISYSDNLDEDFIHESFENILSTLHEDVNRGVELDFHTGLFIEDDISLLDSFKNIAVNSYISFIDYLDFESSPDIAKESINSWVSNRTEGKINETISSALSTNTKCIGVSFITFKSSWAFGFNSSITENGIFNTGTKNIIITMMTTLMNALYFRNEVMGFEIISLPFRMNSYAMYILQPIDGSDVNELQRIENSLDPLMLNSTLKQMTPKFMKVTIPRMKLEFKHSLKGDLMFLDVNQIFNPGADFSRMTTNPEIIIDDLIHVGVLEINEAGINTDIVSDEYVMNDEGSFHLNKPSVMFIEDKDNEYIIYWGKVIEPQPLP